MIHEFGLRIIKLFRKSFTFFEKSLPLARPEHTTFMTGDNIFKFAVDEASNVPKFRQLIDSVNNAIAENRLQVNDRLPSMNQVCGDYNLSRDTVFKAYSILKEQGVVESIPNKGYFVAREIRRVFLFLDTFKAYKEVLYHSFIKNLSDNILADVHFHHYNIDVFRSQIEGNLGKYSKYVIMPFDNKKMSDILNLVPIDKLLVIDWNIHTTPEHNVLYQDFGHPVVEGLEEVLHLIKRYEKLVFLYPEFTDHPIASVNYFEKFCKKHHIPYEVLTQSTNFEVKRGVAYFSVSDRMLGYFLEQCREKKMEPGRDTGLISYNETPMKKFIYKGITVISTDFRMLGKKAAEFVSTDMKMNFCVPTKVCIRESL